MVNTENICHMPSPSRVKAMLSSVLNSERAIEVDVEIMRAFVRLRKMLSSHADLARKLAALENKYDEQFKVVFDAIRALRTPPEKTRKQIGFQLKEHRATYSTKKNVRINNVVIENSYLWNDNLNFEISQLQ